MPENSTFKLLAREQQHSDFDWMNIDRGATRVGKVRGLVDGKSLTIYSINIFHEFEGHGYAKETIEMFKTTFDPIIADRVRHTASGFWTKMGFVDRGGGSYVYHKEGGGSAATAKRVAKGL
jgi:hypothetical protein